MRAPWLLALLPLAATAAPIQLHHQARVLDASGAPLSGPVELELSIHPDGGAGASLWSERMTLTAVDGYVSAVLGADADTNPLQDSTFDGSPRYLQLARVQGGVATALGPRQLIATVPEAVHARNVSGGTASVSSASVSGTLRLGADTDTCPGGDAAGTLRWNAGSNALELCDGVDWRTVTVNGAGSCAEIKQQDPDATSGTYTVNPGGGTALEVYCDMGGSIGRTLLMRIEGTTSLHVSTNARVGAYPCTPSSTTCRLSTDEISRFIAEPGIQVFEVDPDPSNRISWFQRAATDSQLWPTNLEATNRANLAGSAAWSWILTQYQSYTAALNGTGGDTGDYNSANHYYPTAYSSEQIFFRGNSTGLRASTGWDSNGVDSVAGALWVY